jgi:hypothetical protein
VHAAPDRRPGIGLGKRGAIALLPLILPVAVACTPGSSDPGALDTPSVTVPPAAPPPGGGPSVTFSGARPVVAGAPAATTTLDRVAAGLPSGCEPTTERDDTRVVSVAWRCGTRLAAATVDLGGAQLSLGDILTGAWAAYLSSVAQAQFQVEGITRAATNDFATWYVTPAALAVVFAAGVVSYPLASLGPYLRSPSAL